MNRKLLIVVVLAAIAALFAGVSVGRNLLSTTATATKPGPAVIEFKDEVSKVSIDYPGSWERLPADPQDPDRALVAHARSDATTLLLVRVSASGLAPVSMRTLPIVRRFTDDLIRANPGVKLLVAPVPVQLGGLPGYRYRYTTTLGEESSAHDHYFLFKNGRLIQLVFQASPPQRLPTLEPLFERIAGSFLGNVS